MRSTNPSPLTSAKPTYCRWSFASQAVPMPMLISQLHSLTPQSGASTCRFTDRENGSWLVSNRTPTTLKETLTSFIECGLGSFVQRGANRCQIGPPMPKSYGYTAPVGGVGCMRGGGFTWKSTGVELKTKS